MAEAAIFNSDAPSSVCLGIIGTGLMASAHAQAFQQMEKTSCTLIAACDLKAEALAGFSHNFQIANTYSNVEDLLADPQLDAVSIITPDACHAQLSIAALEAGKHVLCEKPLALSYGDAQRMVTVAKTTGLQNMVNFSYRNAPALQQAQQIIASGEIGEIIHIEARYFQSWLSSQVWGDWRSNPAWLWRLSTQHGSKGVLGDIGVHILDFASFPVATETGAIEAVHCTLKTFEFVKGKQLGEYPLDANDSALINLTFASGALANLNTSRWATGHTNSLYMGIYGTKGGLKIDLDASPNILQLCDEQNKDRAHWYTVYCPQTPSNYQRFVHSIKTGCAEPPDFARGAEIQRVLDACFVSDEQQGRYISINQIQP